MNEIPYMMENTPEEFERVKRAISDPIRTGSRADWERYVQWLQDGRPELKTADEWSEIKGIIIRDPDGWRVEGAPAWDVRITEAEFIERAAGSTIQLLPGRTFGV